jgi:hypothetical protein
MKYEPNDVMVEAAARALYEHDADDSGWPVAWEDIDEMDEPHIKQKVYLRQARAALHAAFAAAIESGEAREARGYEWGMDDQWTAKTQYGYGTYFPCLILRTQEGEK